MRSLLPLLAAALAGVAPCSAQQPAAGPPPPRRVAVRAARMIDPASATVVRSAVVLIEGDRIAAAGPNVQVPKGVQVIDLGGATLLPGLIDAHAHVTSQPSENYYVDRFRRSPVDEAVTAHVYARRTLEAGFTTIRNLGAAEYIDVALRDAISRGDVPGPRIVAATLPLSATGGHGDLNGFSPYLRFEQTSDIADGVDEIRKAIRTRVKYGADVIKILATAGVLSEEESVGAPQYSQEEMNAAVEEAAMWGRRVAAHAHGAEGIKRAIRAGVASVEHASFIDDEGIRLAREKGTYLVMDIYNDDYILQEGAKAGMLPESIEKERKIGRLQRENFGKAWKAGARMAFGTDAGVYPHGDNAKQFAYMVKYGMSPARPIRAQPSSAADAINRKDDVGTVEAGKFADIIAVRGDPLSDITLLEHVPFVMKGGEILKS